jgi:hypothetical protein
VAEFDEDADHLIGQIGVNPRDYDPAAYPSLGAFLAEMSRDFVNHVHDLIVSTQKTLGLIIVT